MLKRKSTLSYFSGEDNDEEEDEWEREASTSSSTGSRRKQIAQPNPYAMRIEILEQQHDLLSNKEREMEQELRQLQAIISQMDRETEELDLDIKQSKQEYLLSVEEILSVINKENTVKEETKTNTNSEIYDGFLSNEVDSLLQKWKNALEPAVLAAENNQEFEQNIKSMEKKFKDTEFEVFDLIAQINGYHARIQSVKRDTDKLNSLPQILPILQSEIEKHKLEIDNTTSLLDKLEKESVRPDLIKLCERKITLPLREDQYAQDIEIMNDLLHNLEEVYKIAMKQRACQHLISWIDNDTDQKDSVTASNFNNELKSYTSNIEDQARTASLEKEIAKMSLRDKSSNETQQLLKYLLDKFFESKKDIELFTSVTKENMTLKDQINALKEYEEKLKEKWNEDIHACLDAANELRGLQSRLSQTLYIHSQGGQESNLILTPKPYADLQGQLEFRAAELQASISELQKNVDSSSENAIFEQQRKLFSMFYIDPDRFIELFEKIKGHKITEMMI